MFFSIVVSLHSITLGLGVLNTVSNPKDKVFSTQVKFWRICQILYNDDIL